VSELKASVFSARSRAYATMSVSVCLSVCLSVCDGSALAHYSYFGFQIPIQICGRGEG